MRLFAAALLAAACAHAPADGGGGATVDVAALRRAAPGTVVHLEGYVLQRYRCPPCPPDAMCKPCMMASALFIGASATHAEFQAQNPPADVAVIGIDDPTPFETGTRVSFEVRVVEKRPGLTLDAVVERTK